MLLILYNSLLNKKNFLFIFCNEASIEVNVYKYSKNFALSFLINSILNNKIAFNKDSIKLKKCILTISV